MLEEKSGDHQSQQASSSGHHECRRECWNAHSLNMWEGTFVVVVNVFLSINRKCKHLLFCFVIPNSSFRSHLICLWKVRYCILHLQCLRSKTANRLRTWNAAAASKDMEALQLWRDDLSPLESLWSNWKLVLNRVVHIQKQNLLLTCGVDLSDLLIYCL